MRRYSLKIFLISFLSLAIVSGVFAQRQTGTIKGTVKDSEENPLPGVTVEITSEAIMGVQSYVTTQTGAFRFPAVPPGTYTMKAEMPGFQTIKRENILVRVGMTITINITMVMSTIKEEITVTAPAPVIDIESTKVTTHFDTMLIENIPIARDIYDIVNAAPGAISGEDTRYRYTSFHGSGVRSNAYAIDGVNMTGPAYGRLLTHINQDITEEIEFVTAALPAEVANASGAYINVVTRSGGNQFTGSGLIYYTDESLTKSVWTDDQLNALGVSKPAAPLKWTDTSFTLGGPIIKDRLWFFTSGRYIYNTLSTTFQPFTDPLARYHKDYDWKHEEWMVFGKLTYKVLDKLKLTGMFNFFNRARPYRGDPEWFATEEYYCVWDEDVYTGNFQAQYVLDQNTFGEFRVNFADRIESRLLQPETADLPRIMWQSDPRSTITNARWNETFDEMRIRVGTYWTRFQDDFLGGSHEIKLGAEFEHFSLRRHYWRADNLSWWWWQDTPYYYGRVTWNGIPNIGRSRIYFQFGGATKESTYYDAKGSRIGLYVHDFFTIGRLTLNLGLRYDRTWGWEPPAVKGEGGNPVSVYVGENYVSPYVASNFPEQFPDGINPYAEMTSPGFADLMVWNNFSPRMGFTFDIFGDGKTVFKASYARYTEIMMTQYYEVLNPFYAIWGEGFDWYDMNDNQLVDIGDDFVVRSYDYRRFDPEFSKSKLDPDTSSPITDAVTVGIERELFKNLSVGASYIYKHGHNIFEAVAYDTETAELWYHMDLEAAQRYYVPFTAAVPGTDEYPDTTVTIYTRKTNAPPMFNYAINVPELWRKYQALEFKFQKRMSQGWQLLGSVVWSKAYGTWGGLGGQTWGWEVSGNQPNFYVNREGRINIDRPLVIKLMGTVHLPYGLLLSGYFRHSSGSPWARYALIRPPTSFTSANGVYRWYYGVLLEEAGSRRNRSSDNLDLRLEKEFRIGDVGRLGVYVDAYNVFGWSNISVGMDDIYRYNPTAENELNPAGITQESTYKLVGAASGVRTIRFSLRFNF